MSTNDDSNTLTQAVHDLASALWFGGNLMGVAGVNKSGSDLSVGKDRIAVAASAWHRFSPVQWGSIATVLVTGTLLTKSSSQRLALQEGYARTGAIKVGFVLAGAAATAYASYCGHEIARAAEAAERRGEPVSVKDATTPTQNTPHDLAAWQRRQRVAQVLVPLLAGGNIACNAALVQSYRAGATAKGVLGRLHLR
ncbi:hypothetical protein [Kineococcus radiotolerans]|uniref:Uncharacterized protein n=1 Tax=Kineococcus radiotolerans (strain ATCC BAA-149 / DSM 14245 / SRS30216) TaxID=266940 RepID=A6W4K2_KINRD|nr:hypothetical protein [Kineococcus radiotolerans]ABS01741.1 conserved hypothetical protein [Kineococcus radiotolerans SRS30216 = ATCC BAA-149]